MKSKYAMITRADKNCKELIETTHCILQDYAKQWNCDFIVLDESKDEDWMKTYEDRHYRILQVGDILDNYERAIVIDSDVVIVPGCENPFDVVAPEKIGSIYEDKGSRQQHRRQIIKDIQAKFGDVGWKEGYINTGFMIVSKQHKKIFEKINGESLWTEFGYDDPLLAYNAHKYGFEIQELDCKFNFMSMHGESWNGSKNRFDAFVIHYSGAAMFEDDQSGRKKGSNDLASRIELIKSDIERITAGIMVFRETHLTEKQGLGSFVWTAVFGVQNREIILKVHKTRIGLEREVQAFQHNIPYLVDYMGVCEDPNVGKFIMLEKLKDLPEVINADLMKEIATKSLIAMRQLYKHGVPWICRLDHIMMDDNGRVKLIDFNDDSLPKVPFYAEDGSEAIMMHGVCDSEGLYTHRYHAPRSGWIAIMEYLCKKNGLGKGVLYEAEHAMIEYEYQALENVHQPIYFDQYKDILRRETEKDDKDYGKLVEPNRKCEDRAKMIMDNIDLHSGQTWLDIGCNIGWFCFNFENYYTMKGIDFDKAKIEFATMLAEGNMSDVKFEHAEINLEYVLNMPSYDIISALSTLHLKLIEDKKSYAFWNLFAAISEKTNDILLFEFPPHAYGVLMVEDTEHLIKMIKASGKFKEVIQIGITDANRPMLKCVK